MSALPPILGLPLPYSAAAAYCIALGLRRAWSVGALLRGQPTAATSFEHGYQLGRLVTRVLISAVQVAGGAVVLAGWAPARWALIATLAGPVRREFREFATDFAEGRKGAALAAAPEYVRGRAAPGGWDYAAAAAFVGVRWLLPIAALLLGAPG